MSIAMQHVDRLLALLTQALSPEIARKIAEMRADEQTLARVDELARKANNGELTAERLF